MTFYPVLNKSLFASFNMIIEIVTSKIQSDIRRYVILDQRRSDTIPNPNAALNLEHWSTKS